MGSAFFEMNIASTGLFAAQRGLAVTGNNISNAATKGYSRQVLDQRASSAMPGYGRGMIGTGVDTTGVRRVRDSYLDQKMWGQKPALGEYKIKAEQNSIIESVFGEPSDTGFTKVFDDFFTAIDNLSKLPSEGERQEALRQMSISFTKYYNSAAQKLTEYQRDLNFEMKAKVEEINNLVTRITSLNDQIYRAELNGDIANTLRDDRELCVDRLSQIVNIDAKEVDVTRPDGKVDKQFQIKLNGQVLVDGTYGRLLKVSARTQDEKKNPEDADGLYDIKWEDGLPFYMDDKDLSGELKGIIDMRDGRGSSSFTMNGEQQDPSITYKGIPYYINKLDQFVQTFAKSMNEVYNQAGTEGGQVYTDLTLDDGTTIKIPKHALFTYTEGNSKTPVSIEDMLLRDKDGDIVLEEVDGEMVAQIDYSKMTAKQFSVSDTVYDGASNIRTNFEHDPVDGSNPNPSSNDLLLALGAQKNNNKMFKDGDPKDFMISMFSELGINAKEAAMYQKTQTNVTTTIENQRLSVSQVDPNEEFINLVKYNQAYQAAAKVLTTMDGIYETTIFKLGSW